MFSVRGYVKNVLRSLTRAQSCAASILRSQSVLDISCYTFCIVLFRLEMGCVKRSRWFTPGAETQHVSMDNVFGLRHVQLSIGRR